MDGAALYDANVLYPASLRDLLIRLGVAGLVAPRWTNQILDEMVEALLEHHTHLARPDLERTRDLMCKAIPESMIDGYQPIIPSLNLPDPDDRHVLAAAIHGDIDTIVTSNLKDFPSRQLVPHGIRAISPDAFLLELIHTSWEDVFDVVTQQAAALRRPAHTPAELMDRLERNGLAQSMQALGAHTIR